MNESFNLKLFRSFSQYSETAERIKTENYVLLTLTSTLCEKYKRYCRNLNIKVVGNLFANWQTDIKISTDGLDRWELNIDQVRKGKRPPHLLVVILKLIAKCKFFKRSSEDWDQELRLEFYVQWEYDTEMCLNICINRYCKSGCVV